MTGNTLTTSLLGGSNDVKVKTSLATCVIAIGLGYVIALNPDGAVVITHKVFTFTDRDLILLLVSIGAFFLPRLRRSLWTPGAILPIALWIAYLTIRAFFSSAPKTAGFFVDLRSPLYVVSAYAAGIVLVKLGSMRALSGLVWLAYVQAAIGVVAFALLHAGAISGGSANNPFGIFSRNPQTLARPGSEFLVPWALCAVDVRHIATGERLRKLGTVLLIASLIFAGTLTNVIAVGAGLGIYVLHPARGDRARRTLLAIGIVVLAGVLVLSASTTGLGSRYNLSGRLASDSASYRVAELADLRSQWLGQGKEVAMVGVGPGSQVKFYAGPGAGYIQKNDTHDSYGNIGFKFGLVGLIVLISLLWRPLRIGVIGSSNRLRRSMRAGLVALLIASITAPYLTTTSGYCFLGVLYALSSVRAVRDPGSIRPERKVEGESVIGRKR